MSLDVSVSGREQVADWIETTLLARGTRPLGNDELYSLAATEIQLDVAQVSLGLGVMRRRSALLGPKYPFSIHEVAIMYREGAIELPYASLLFLTPEGIARQTVLRETSTEMEILFERISEAAVGNLWGPHGRALRFGWPSDNGRPQGFNEAVTWLAKQIGIEPGVGYRPPGRKDGGVDVIAWRPFPDARGGMPIVLVQCTLQSDILPKASDVDTRVWASWLVLDFDPITALAVAQTVPAGTLWDQLALRGMVLDRVRLADLIAPNKEILGLLEFNTSVVSQLQDYMTLGAQ